MTDRLPPLCVDCDGTLVHTDLLHEACLRLLKTAPLLLFALPFWLLKGKWHLKCRLAEFVSIDASMLPYSEAVVSLIQAESNRGRRILLATASPERFAHEVSEHLGLFDDVIATTPGSNLSGPAKAAALVDRFGRQGFDYVGNSSDDVHVWREARQGILVDASERVRKAATACTTITDDIRKPNPGPIVYLKALRVHQWLKNLLVLVPLLAAHRLTEPATLLAAVSAMAAFSLCASSIYILNDLLDLPNDRRHPRKRERPFAAGHLSIVSGIALSAALLVATAAIAIWLPPEFWLVLAGYLATTTLYSIWLKQMVVVDVLTLAALYTFRIIAGCAATGIAPSFWLLAFSLFLFLSLAVVKRYSELLALAGLPGSKTPGRGYRSEDLPLLLSIGTSSGYMAVLVLALYIDSADVGLLYRTPMILWLTIPLLLYWISRVWMKTQRGQMHDDPVVFAATDRISLIVALLIATIFVSAVTM